MRKNIYDERRLFYYDIVFICHTDAYPYLKMLMELGEMRVLHALVDKYNDSRVVADAQACYTHTSMGSEDHICQTETHALTYNVRMEYFHLWGRTRVASHCCIHCGMRRPVDKLKYDSSVDDVICSMCADPKYYDNL